MKKIVYVPLDQRPCNAHFPSMLFHQEPIEVVRPPDAWLGFKKEKADLAKLDVWLEDMVENADGLVLSLDMLVYGGLVPSRLHHDEVDVLIKRIEGIKRLKAKYPNVIIYGFSMIMRAPGYNSDAEEPSYYAQHGKAIFMHGYLEHKIKLGIATEAEKMTFSELEVPSDYLSDFVNRRHINIKINQAMIALVKECVIDFLVIPQDDSAPYGFTAKDQDIIRETIHQMQLQMRVLLYPGADEVGMVLTARMASRFLGRAPKVVIKYPSITSGSIIPNIEDRYLDTTVRYQVTASGGIVVDSLEDADLVFFVNAPSDHMLSRLTLRPEGLGMHTNRHLPETFTYLLYAQHLGKTIVIGDITYGNGSSLEIYHYLVQTNLLYKIGGYAGWNTASNALGSALAEGISSWLFGKTQQALDFLCHRYIEDIAYCGYVRQHIKQTILPLHSEWHYEDVKEAKGEFSVLVKKELETFMALHMPTLLKVCLIEKVSMPWRRMYEIELKIKYNGELS